MKGTFFKIAGLVLGIAAFGSLYSVRIHGQSSVQSSRSALTTNWVGSLVVGKQDTADRITPGLSPTVVGPVELGLRSDGVVVWRKPLEVGFRREK